MTIYILFFIAIVVLLYLWFKGKNVDSNDTWTSKLNEKTKRISLEMNLMHQEIQIMLCSGD